MAVPRGRARRLLVGAGRRGHRAGPPDRARGHRGRPGWTSPGRWAGGFRAWDEHGVYLATGRGGTPGPAAAGAGRGAAGAARPSGSRSPAHLIEGLYRTARTIESTARQRDALVTLGTLAAGLAHEINNPAAAATRVGRRAATAPGEAAGRRSAPLADGRRSPPPSSPRWTRCAARSPPSDGVDPTAPGRDREEELAAWLEPARVSQTPGRSPPPLAAAGVDLALVRAVPRRCWGARRSSPALEWVAASTRRVSRAAGRGEGVDPPDLRARRRRPVVLPDGPGLDAADRRHRGAREHAGDARPQAARRGQRGPRLRRRRAAASRRTPAS